jgi:hypothetical protein
VLHGHYRQLRCKNTLDVGRGFVFRCTHPVLLAERQLFSCCSVQLAGVDTRVEQQCLLCRQYRHGWSKGAHADNCVTLLPACLPTPPPPAYLPACLSPCIPACLPPHLLACLPPCLPVPLHLPPCPHIPPPRAPCL